MSVATEHQHGPGASDRRPPLVRAYDGLISSFAILAGLMIVSAMLVVCADVLLRAVSTRSLPWSFEVTEFLLVYIPLLTLPWLVRRRQHIAIDIFTSWLRPNVKRHLSAIVMIVATATCLFVTYWGILATLAAYERGITNAGLVAYPRWALLVAIPIGFGTAAIEFARVAWQERISHSAAEHQNISSVP